MTINWYLLLHIFFQLHKNPDNAEALQQVNGELETKASYFIKIFLWKQIFPGYVLVYFLSFLFSSFIVQLNVIEPIRKDVSEARNAINMGDYSLAIEFLGRAIEVLLNIDSNYYQ